MSREFCINFFLVITSLFSCYILEQYVIQYMYVSREMEMDPCLLIVISCPSLLQ